MCPEPDIKFLKEQLKAKEDMLDRTTKYLLSARKDLEKVNLQLTLTNDELTSSIRFAKRIQQPLIPSEELLNSFFDQSGIYINQKFHIGGDYIYSSPVQNAFVFGLFDCTGHGVPGALLAIYGHSLLGEIINKLEVTDPADILNLMSLRIYRSFSETSASSSVETMDGILCHYDYKNQTLSYSSAKRIAFILREGKTEELKVTKSSIGETENTNFTDQKVKVVPGEKIILFSDGLTDQYDHEDRKKFGRRNLQKIIEQHSNLGAKALAIQIRNSLSDWQGDNEQTDDISFLIIDI